jgi:hypothetical protein
MTTFKNIKHDKEKWTIVKFKIPLVLFLKKFNGKLSAFHRILSNGRNLLMGKTNREFWKNIKQGYYRSYFGTTHVHFVYFIYMDEFRQIRLFQELSIRIRKIINVKVEILPFDFMDEVDLLLITLPFGLSNFKKIKG